MLESLPYAAGTKVRRTDLYIYNIICLKCYVNNIKLPSLRYVNKNDNISMVRYHYLKYHTIHKQTEKK